MLIFRPVGRNVGSNMILRQVLKYIWYAKDNDISIS